MYIINVSLFFSSPKPIYGHLTFILAIPLLFSNAPPIRQVRRFLSSQDVHCHVPELSRCSLTWGVKFTKHETSGQVESDT